MVLWGVQNGVVDPLLRRVSKQQRSNRLNQTSSPMKLHRIERSNPMRDAEQEHERAEGASCSGKVTSRHATPRTQLDYFGDKDLA
jgi:hypothetical protein